MKIFKSLLFIGMLFASSLSLVAQYKITGTVQEGDFNEPLFGANVLIKGTQTGTATDTKGDFELSTSQKTGEVVISYYGFESKTVSFTVTGNTVNLGTVTLMPQVGELDEVILVGKGVVDLAADRKTPIAVSTVKALEIQEKAGNWDLPEVIKSSPSIQNVKGGGFGDGAMYLRGFDQTNTAFLLNGQPINGMEDGRMYWSNWSGVMDIANAVQVQRGLGSSKLAISSVGGTVNIVTKTLDTKQGGFVQQMLGNNDYTKTTAYYSTGLMNDKFAFSAMLGHWQGDGYIDMTKGQGQTYFLSFGYKVNKKNRLNLLVTGAPQWHGASNHLKMQTFLDEGRRFNNNYGYINGRYYAGGRNFYHKPIINFNWDYDINDKMSLSTVAYGSYGRGGFAFLSGVGRVDGDPNGLYDFDGAISSGSGYAKASVNAHNWFGLISNLEYKLNENLSVNFGADGRMYNGKHYRNIVDFFGVTSVNHSSDQQGSYTITNTYGYNPWDALFNSEPGRKDKLDRDYEEWINYMGAFGQVEYAKDAFSVYFQGAISNQSHQRQGYYTNQEIGKSKKVNNLGYNTKIGGAILLAENHKVFANVGYYSRQPFHDDIYVSSQFSNQLNIFSDINQKITGLEAGYQFKSNFVDVNLNGYYTIWDDRALFGNQDTDNDGVADIFSQSSPAKQVHSGVELEVFSRPLTGLNVNGFVSLGNWVYDGNVTNTNYDDAGNVLSQGDTKYLDGAKVGNAAQFTAGVNANYTIFKGFKIDAAFNFYDNLYADTERNLSSNFWNDPNNKGSVKLPSYETVDAGLSYKWLVGVDKKNSINFRLNINNVFDELYVENSRDNIHLEAGDVSWRGLNVNNRVKLGYGRTWNFAIRFNF